MTAFVQRAGYTMGASYDNPRYLSVSADLTATAWKTAAKHEVFTVTGLVRMRMWNECTSNVGSSGGNATICFGHESDTDAFIADTDEEALDTGELWYDDTPTLLVDTFNNCVMDYVSNGLDIGYEVKGEALNAGGMTFHCVWEPLNATGAVVAGTGVAL